MGQLDRNRSVTRNQPKRSTGEATMNDMPPTPAHAKPAPRDYLWVLAVIAACDLIKVSPSWVGIAASAGFPRFGKIPTDWTLAVIMEAYWAYALYAWLAASAGPRSRRFAMWSAAGVFALSLAGQSAARLVGAKAMTAFANGMPVIVLALIAILVHLRQLDRADAARAEEAARRDERARAEEAAAADERTALRAELDTLAGEVEPLREALAAATKQAEEDAQKRAILERKLAAQKPSRARANPARAKSATARAEQMTKDVDARTKALSVLAAEPDISGAALGPRVGMSKRWGQLHRDELVAMAADLEQSQESS